MEIFQGTEGFGAVGLGTVRVIRRSLQKSAGEVSDRDSQLRSYESTKIRVINELKARKSLGSVEAASLLMLMEDHQLDDAIVARIYNQGRSAYEAITGAGKHMEEMLAANGDRYLNAKGSDIKQLSKLLLSYLDGYTGMDVILPDDCIVVADSLTTSDFLKLDRSRLRGLVVENSSANSHMAILAKAMEIPTIVGCEIKDEWNGRKGCVDGGWRVLYLEPDEQTVADMEKRIAQHRARNEALEDMRGRRTITKGGREVHLYANIGSPDELSLVLENDAEGVGLYRTEAAYIGRPDPPSEEELFTEYRTVAATLGSRELVLRTIDISPGTDAPYLPFERSADPAMGLRGIRLCLKCQSIFRTQLRAILRAAVYGNISIMLPMISGVDEFESARSVIDDCLGELREQDIPCRAVRVGAMIETPAAVMMSEELAKAADFLSIGTNDLTQYTLCVDRENRDTTEFCDYHHPAVMKMVQMTVHNAKKMGTPVGICGELAGDEKVVPSFIDMGVEALSCVPGRVLSLRSFICEL